MLEGMVPESTLLLRSLRHTTRDVIRRACAAHGTPVPCGYYLHNTNDRFGHIRWAGAQPTYIDETRVPPPSHVIPYHVQIETELESQFLLIRQPSPPVAAYRSTSAARSPGAGAPHARPPCAPSVQEAAAHNSATTAAVEGPSRQFWARSLLMSTSREPPAPQCADAQIQIPRYKYKYKIYL